MQAKKFDVAHKGWDLLLTFFILTKVHRKQAVATTPCASILCNWGVVGASRPAEKRSTDFNIASRLCCTAHEHCKSGLRFDR